jgi:hypothetical protein
MGRIEVKARDGILLRIALVMAAGIASLGGAGCASARYAQAYDGPPRAEQQAIIKGNRMRGWRIGIMLVDGEFSVSPFNFSAASGKWPNSVGVLPGKHTIRANLQYRSWGGEMDLWWVAQARGSYTIYAESKDSKFRLWIVDDATRRTVGGVVGSSDEPK